MIINVMLSKGVRRSSSHLLTRRPAHEIHKLKRLELAREEVLGLCCLGSLNNGRSLRKLLLFYDRSLSFWLSLGFLAVSFFVGLTFPYKDPSLLPIVGDNEFRR